MNGPFFRPYTRSPAHRAEALVADVALNLSALNLGSVELVGFDLGGVELVGFDLVGVVGDLGSVELVALNLSALNLVELCEAGRPEGLLNEAPTPLDGGLLFFLGSARRERQKR